MSTAVSPTALFGMADNRGSHISKREADVDEDGGAVFDIRAAECEWLWAVAEIDCDAKKIVEDVAEELGDVP